MLGPAKQPSKIVSSLRGCQVAGEDEKGPFPLKKNLLGTGCPAEAPTVHLAVKQGEKLQ